LVGLERVGIDLPLYLESNAAYRDVNRRQSTFSKRKRKKNKQLIKERERKKKSRKKIFWPVLCKTPSSIWTT
jgi:hypothetical protein